MPFLDSLGIKCSSIYRLLEPEVNNLTGVPSMRSSEGSSNHSPCFMNGPPPFGCFDGEIDVWKDSKGIGKHLITVPAKSVERREDHPTPSYLSMANIQHAKPHSRFMKAFRFLLRSSQQVQSCQSHIHTVTRGENTYLTATWEKMMIVMKNEVECLSYWTTEAHKVTIIEGGEKKKLEIAFREKRKAPKSKSIV